MTRTKNHWKKIYSSERMNMPMVRMPRALISIAMCLLLSVGGNMFASGSATHTEGPGDFESGETDRTSTNSSGIVLATHDSEIGNWTMKMAITAPSPRSFPSIAYDENNSSIILFGGKDKTGYRNDTWKYDWDSDSWTEMKPKGIPELPSPRQGHSMVYNDNNSAVIMFGGWTGENSISNETWVYYPANNSWVRKYPSDPPPSRAAYGFAYDAENDVAILFGGSNASSIGINDTWTYDLGRDAWTEMRPIPSPPPRFGPGMAYDRIGKGTVLFSGGFQGPVNPFEIRDTWSYDHKTNTWTEMSPSIQPAERVFHQMVYNGRLGEILLFGGVTDPQIFVRNDTWSYNLTSNQWTYQLMNCSPPSTYAFTLAYDAKNNATVLFGGFDSNQKIGHNQTWSHIFDGYEPDGRFTSQPVDTGGQAYFGSIGWNATVPPTCSIRFQLRTANSSAELTGGAFVGPDGTALTYYNKSGQRVFSGHDSTGWLQYKAFLNSTYPLQTPLLRNVSFAYNLMHNLTLLYPTGGENLSAVQNIRWLAADPDNDTLAFDLILLKGINSITLATDLPGGAREFAWNTSGFASGNYRLKIIARDVNSSIPLETEVTSAVFTVYNAPPPPPNNPPWAELLAPEDGASFDGTAVDFEWQGGDDDGDTLRFRFYIDTAELDIDSLPVPKITTSLTTYTMSNLVPGTTYYWTVAASDGKDNSTVPAPRQFSIPKPPPENRPPSVELVFPDDGSVLNTTTVTLSWNASDPDGDSLLFSVFSKSTQFDQWTLPEPGARVSDTAFVLADIANGTTVWWTVVASDGKAESPVLGVWKFTVNIAWGNRPPEITTQPPLAARAGSPYEYLPVAIDRDGDALTFALVTGPAGMALEAATGRLTWTPKAGQGGNNPVVLRVTDTKGGYTEQAFTIDVSVTFPTCTIQYPSENEIVGPDFVIRGVAEKGVAALWKVELRMDGGAWMTATGTTNWSYRLDSRDLTAGMHRIEARAIEPELESEITSVDFEIKSTTNVPAAQKADLLPVGILLAVALIALGLSAYAIMRKRRMKERA